ncbi:hypothetical protein Tco_1170585 [Tanacetum coccineum]
MKGHTCWEKVRRFEVKTGWKEMDNAFGALDIPFGSGRCPESVSGGRAERGTVLLWVGVAVAGPHDVGGGPAGHRRVRMPLLDRLRDSEVRKLECTAAIDELESSLVMDESHIYPQQAQGIIKWLEVQCYIGGFAACRTLLCVADALVMRLPALKNAYKPEVQGVANGELLSMMLHSKQSAAYNSLATTAISGGAIDPVYG